MRIVLATAAVLAFATGAATAQQSVRTGPAAPELAEGKAVYAHWCAPCHADSMGLAGTNSLTIKYEGTDIPGVLEDRTDLTAPVISYFVRNGIAWMPPFRRTEISDAELAALSAYLTAPLEDRGAHTPLLAEEMAEMEAAR
ncbi:hypothetical protein GCM10023208_05180 [Erythrobacter westpacificensis]|uniref:Cytochrome c domain-containing protein n=1 Tax=Erythrobacter westpacificensis TaxID=1055231 RepID=A0ABP9K2Q5_9SPHN